jgi:hypothetical protein
VSGAPQPTHPSRPVLVLDGDGVVVADFPDAELAELWARRLIRQPGARLPVHVADTTRDRTWRIWPASCRVRPLRRRVRQLRPH